MDCDRAFLFLGSSRPSADQSSISISRRDKLAALGIPQESLQITPIGRPELDQIQELLSPFPDLQWLALLPQLRPLLTNLKVLDWFAGTPPKSQAGDDQQYVGLTAVIDQLWQLWTESPADGLARSHLLMKLATTEA